MSEYRRLSDAEKCLLPRTQLGMQPGRPAMLVSESGLYKLVMRSDKPEGEPWFVAADVCKAIGYAVRPNGTTNASLLRSILGSDEVFTTQTSKTGRPSLCISESGLYKLIMRSDKPEARAFQDWVTKVVLPAIQKKTPGVWE